MDHLNRYMSSFDDATALSQVLCHGNRIQFHTVHFVHVHAVASTENAEGLVMMGLVNVCLACGAFYVGFQAYNRRRIKIKIWLKKPDSPAKTSFLPSATRIYIVRAWKEQTRKADQAVTRYALEIPGTGQRWGFTSEEALLDSLSVELANT